MQPEFLEVEDVLQIHTDQMERYGGLLGLRDLGLLISAVSMPKAMHAGRFLHEDIFAMAGAYLFHITRNHPFLDGNKRAGAASALVFLDMHGIEVTADDDALYELVIGVAINAGKGPLFSLDERVELVEQALEPLRKSAEVVVEPFEGLTVNFARKVGANMVQASLRCARGSRQAAGAHHPSKSKVVRHVSLSSNTKPVA